MNTRIIMILSALILFILGIISTFMPEEILRALGQTSTPIFSIIIQILGAVYLGFAFMNWMSKSHLIGGIYSRPLAIGNFTHFLIGGLTLLKFVLHSRSLNFYIIILTIVYLVFAVAFGIIFQRTPKRISKQD